MSNGSPDGCNPSEKAVILMNNIYRILSGIREHNSNTPFNKEDWEKARIVSLFMLDEICNVRAYHGIIPSERHLEYLRNVKSFIAAM